MRTASEIAERLFAGDRAALARMISWAENGHSGFAEALALVYERVGRSWRIGVTGPPGAGKSTLVNRMVGVLREAGHSVAILAIDPSSPFTGGALLGDRIRMEERTGDAGVFIRSMASRKSHGGLARAAVDACDVMDAFGFDFIIVETVGVGQSEYDVVSAADTVLLVLCPGAGDGIQAMKAGILEVADVLVVNKSDLPGADQLCFELEDAMRLRELVPKENRGWEVPIVRACSMPGKEGADGPEGGMNTLVDAVEAHRASMDSEALAAARAKKRLAQVRRVVGEKLEDELWGPRGWSERAESALRTTPTPYDVAEEILTAVLDADTRLKESRTR